MVFDYDKDSKERVPYEYYLERYQKEDPLAISDRTQIPYDEKAGVFTLRLMGCTYQISWPDYQIKAVPENVICHYPLENAANARILVLRYFLEGDGRACFRKVPYLQGNALGRSIFPAVSGTVYLPSGLWVRRKAGSVPKHYGTAGWCQNRVWRLRL